ncbi:hypothetical protein DFH94DRAFT_321978 [Russula ochroleuca]|uniref:Uncharacterized protein n=1 Tax=Russula ochroleuca TaxID=152965 RepID=A0A9P5N1F1_9AGAM|nr:hypothetical protein DFH94DRAFT_321978 [Russula ochroleuca]
MDDGYTGSTAPPHARALLDVWFSFHIIGGHFLVPVLITTFLFSKARRDATLINFGITIILSSITNCLLLYAHEYLGPEPNKTLCIFQAAAFGASAPMWSVAALTLVLQIRSRVELKDVRWLFTMLMMPYISFIAFSVVILVVGLQRPDTVTRSRRTLYCSMEWRSIYAAPCAWSARFNERKFASSRSPSGSSFSWRTSSSPWTSLLSISDRHTYARDIYTSTFGVAYFLVFGSQPDVLWAWCFWRKDETGSRATAESGAPIIEDSTALHKHPTLPDTSHETEA